MIAFGLIITAITELAERMIELGSFALSPGRIYIVAVAILAISNWMTNGSRFSLGKAGSSYLFASGLLLLVTLLSVTESPYVSYSIKRALNTTSVYMLPLVVYVYLRVQASPVDPTHLVRRIGFTIVCTGVFLSLFGVFQELTGFLQRSTEVRAVAGIPFTRINGLHYDGNFFSYYLVFPLWLALAAPSAVNGIESKFLRIAAVALIALALLLTGSRGGVLMLLALGYSHFVYRYAGRRKWLVAMLEAPIVVIVPLVFLLYAYFGFEHIYHSVSKLDTGNESGYSRVLAWYSGLKLYMQSPWLGVGPGNFVTLNKGSFLPLNYVPPWVADRISVLAGHSNVLEVLVESGPLALFAYFSTQFVSYVALLKRGGGDDGVWCQYFRSLIFSAAVGNILISYAPLFLMVLIGALLYITDAEAPAHRRPGASAILKRGM